MHSFSYFTCRAVVLRFKSILTMSCFQNFLLGPQVSTASSPTKLTLVWIKAHYLILIMQNDLNAPPSMEIKTDYTSKSFEIAKRGFFISLRVSLIVFWCTSMDVRGISIHSSLHSGLGRSTLCCNMTMQSCRLFGCMSLQR